VGREYTDLKVTLAMQVIRLVDRFGGTLSALKIIVVVEDHVAV
jgi:hypothetical protein